MSTLTYKKFDEGEGLLPDKMTVYQDCILAFNASPVNAKKCRMLLAKLLRLLSIGETFPSNEATSLFFSISKLFQHKSVELRQIVYLAIKKLCAISDDVLMVTSSIMKDIQNGDIAYRPNAIRTLARVLDSLTVHATERLFKNAIVDRNPNVSSAALVSSYHLSPEAKDVVKRWANETQEAIFAQKYFPETQFLQAHEGFYSRFPASTKFTQYHALGLLYVLRNHDKMALVKMVNQLSGPNSPLSNPMAIVQVIRYISKLIDEDNSLADHLYPYLASWSESKSDMVSLEAAKVVLNCRAFSSQQHLAAVVVLRDMLGGSRVSAFAAVRMMHKVAMVSPEKIAPCNPMLESLINDSNRSVATYAITTLLKTGSADTVDRLVKTIPTFMGDVPDEFRVVVIDAVRNLTLKFPQKFRPMLAFLGDVLRDDGGFRCKNAVVAALFDMIRSIPECRDAALQILCEFIEDCEFPELAVRILHLLGSEGPESGNPTLYIRHIYNRIALENAVVRASAVSALAKFAFTEDEALRKSVEVLLTRSLSDPDDEVRDRAAVALRLTGSSGSTGNVLVVDFIKPTKVYSLPVLEQKLSQYIATGSSYETPFDISSVPQPSAESIEESHLHAGDSLSSESPDHAYSQKDADADADAQADEEARKKHAAAEELLQIDVFAEYGPVLHSSAVVELTEKETEFVVTVVKHVFKEHLVLQFHVDNTLTDTGLSMVSVVASPENELYNEEFILPIETLGPASAGTSYVSFSRSESGGSEYVTETFSNTLSFTSSEIDPKTGEPVDEGFQDEYQIESLDVTIGDFIVPAYSRNFETAYEELPAASEDVGVFNLSDARDIQEVVSNIVGMLSLSALQSTEIVPDKAHSHKLKLYGKSIYGETIAAFISLVSSKNGIVAKATVRSENKALSEAVVNGIA